MTERWVSKVLVDKETGDLAIVFPEDFLKFMSFTEGEYLIWESQANGSVTVSKSKIIDTKP